MSFRISDGALIDRSKEIAFEFEGRRFTGYQGDTLASALLANGVRIVGRSFKYHRPRGLIASGLDEPNGIVQVETGPYSTPNLKSTAVELYNGMRAEAVNRWPSLKYDLLSVNSLIKRFLPAGFYYKTFMWPDWHLFEPTIRAAAGLGESPKDVDPSIYDQKFDHVDLLIVGGGIAGLKSALTAAPSGKSILIGDTEPFWGGRFVGSDSHVEDHPADEWIHATVEYLNTFKNVKLMTRTMAFGYYDHNLIGLCERLCDHLPVTQRGVHRERLWKVRAGKVILATGAHERPIVCPNNDRPGVMLAGAAQIYARRFGIAPGKRIVIATNNSSAYHVASELQARGVDVAAIVDARSDIPDADMILEHGSNCEIIAGTSVTNIKGRNSVKSVEIASIDDHCTAIRGTERWIKCDAVLTSSGWSPAVHLHSQSGGKLSFDKQLQSFVPAASPQDCISIGAASGNFDIMTSLEQAEALTRTILDNRDPAFPPDLSANKPIRPLWYVDTSELKHPERKAWVDYQNDVTKSDVELAVREGFQSVEHVKRYTTLGMATDQGKTSNINGIGIMGASLQSPPNEVGTTKFRPPYNPTSLGVFAGVRVGQNNHPGFLCPSHALAEKLGAVFDDYGPWNRAAYFAKDGEGEAEAVIREVLTTRSGVGVFDASALGKIEVKGPDAAKFIDRLYVNNMLTLSVGNCRYGVMLDENGIVFDDGVVARISEDHFLVGTTSGHASAVFDNMEHWLQCEWTDLDVVVADVTQDWAVVNVAGPKVRELIAHFETTIDFSEESFPHMRFRAGRLAGVPCRVQRVSFTGEASFEISVPWRYGADLFLKFLDRDTAYSVEPFGLEALMIMRVENGFLHVGSDTDGTTIPQDLGFSRIIEKKGRDFIGYRSTVRSDGLRDDRRQLVGLKMLDNGPAPLAGAHVVASQSPTNNVSLGWITSSVDSPTSHQPVLMGLVKTKGLSPDQILYAFDQGTYRPVMISRLGSLSAPKDRLRGLPVIDNPRRRVSQLDERTLETIISNNQISVRVLSQLNVFKIFQFRSALKKSSLQNATGILPQNVGSVKSYNQAVCGCSAPGEWTFVGSGADFDNLLDELDVTPALTLDVSHGILTFEIVGQNSNELLQRFCPFRLTDMEPEKLVRTRFEDVSCQIIKAGFQDRYLLQVRQSVAPYVERLLRNSTLNCNA